MKRKTSVKQAERNIGFRPLPGLRRKLEKRASTERRSMSQVINVILEKELG